MQQITVLEADDGMRLDRWFERHYPGVTRGELHKMLRLKLVKVENKRAEPAQRLAAGQVVKLPDIAPEAKKADKPFTPAEKTMAAALECGILYRDDAVLILNKPAGLAVQGGSKVKLSVDRLLPLFRFGRAEVPRLVHRLDKDTSGILVLARTAVSASFLTTAFRTRKIEKTYLAAVAGVPMRAEGVIDMPLAHQGDREEKMGPSDDGKKAITRYKNLDSLLDKMAWMELTPVTGRKHQLRAHMALLGHPILGDGKYGGHQSFPEIMGIELTTLHLHAWKIRLPQEDGKKHIQVTAPLPPHMQRTANETGFGG
jgi:23S rRNA pseudouridine955/2504/2580 synthase